MINLVSKRIVPKWTEWKKVFLFLPKKTVTGYTIIGPAFYRQTESNIQDYGEDQIGFIHIPQKFQYARDKKEIFKYNLGDEDAV